jgi:tetratricopeptide (TPR) repeat protein
MASAESRRAGVLHAVLLALLVVALYAPTLAFRFNDFDDRLLILESQQVLRDPSFVPAAFFEDAFHEPEAKFYYRPLLTLSFMADASWGRTEPFAYRLTNVLLHLFSVLLAWRLLRVCGAASGAALLAAAAFAVHPALAQAVAWIPGRNDTLLAVFVFASFHAFVRWLDTREARFAALHLAAWTLALFTKETAIAVPVLGLAWALLAAGRRRAQRGDAALVAAWAVLGAAWFALRHHVLANPWTPTAADTAAAVAAAIPTAASALGYLVAPWGLSVYPRPDGAHAAIGAAAVIALAAAAVFAPHGRRGRVAFGLVWLLVVLLPSLARPYLADPGEFLVHRLYLPAFGVVLALAALAPERRTARASRPLRVAGVLAIAALAAGTALFLPSFRDAVSFWEDATASAPRSAFAQRCMGAAYYRAERWGEAAAAWERSFALDPDSAETRNDLSLAYRKMGLSDATRQALEVEIARNPRNAMALYWLGVSLDFGGRYAEAAARWEAAVAIDPEFADAWSALVREALDSGDPARARRYAAQARQRGVSIPPDLLARLAQASTPR